MCEGCWQEYGSSTINNAKVREAAALAEKVYEFAPLGAHLHIVLDDWNLTKDDIRYCLHSIKEYRAGMTEWDHLTNSPEQLDVQERCARLLLDMPLKERASALALWSGYWRLPTHAPGRKETDT